ncbi:MAG: hypothetical protein JWO79_503 [Actinomycetia bacterium]|nr:hypothetical protein [Actinomycetes bacterium]
MPSRTRRFVAVLAVVVVAVVTGAGITEASAADASHQTFKNAHLGKYLQQDPMETPHSNAPIRVTDTGWGADTYHTQAFKPSGWTGNPLRRLVDNDHGGCVDSHDAGKGDKVWLMGCNGGDYQVWEIFHASNGAIVFKSYSAWVRHHQHLCIEGNGDRSATLETCDVNRDWQQWW